LLKARKKNSPANGPRGKMGKHLTDSGRNKQRIAIERRPVLLQKKKERKTP